MSATENTALAAEDVVQILGNWRTLNDAILSLSEPAVRQLLHYELTHERRDQWLSRLHHRFNRLRLLRERQRMLLGDTSWL